MSPAAARKGIHEEESHNKNGGEGGEEKLESWATGITASEGRKKIDR